MEVSEFLVAGGGGDGVEGDFDLLGGAEPEVGEI